MSAQPQDDLTDVIQRLGEALTNGVEINLSDLIRIDWEGRHPATSQLYRWFAYDHLPQGHARHVSEACHDLALQLIAVLPDGPEMSAGLRKLLEAKDCFVRTAIGMAQDTATDNHENESN